MGLLRRHSPRPWDMVGRSVLVGRRFNGHGKSSRTLSWSNRCQHRPHALHKTEYNQKASMPIGKGLQVCRANFISSRTLRRFSMSTSW